MEIHPAVADTARRALDRAGYSGVTIITADGTQGFEARAPYDRVLSTASCQQVPYPWVAQTVPGGKGWLFTVHPDQQTINLSAKNPTT